MRRKSFEETDAPMLSLETFPSWWMLGLSNGTRFLCISQILHSIFSPISSVPYSINRWHQEARQVNVRTKPFSGQLPNFSSSSPYGPYAARRGQDVLLWRDSLRLRPSGTRPLTRIGSPRRRPSSSPVAPPQNVVSRLRTTDSRQTAHKDRITGVERLLPLQRRRRRYRPLRKYTVEAEYRVIASAGVA